MSNHEWEPINENDFETMSGKGASSPPPDDAIEEAAPWRKSRTDSSNSAFRKMF